MVIMYCPLWVMQLYFVIFIVHNLYGTVMPVVHSEKLIVYMHAGQGGNDNQRTYDSHSLWPLHMLY